MKIKIYLFTFIIALSMLSCDDFLDVNTDPNNPVQVSPDLILPVGQVYTARYFQEDRGLNHLGNMMMFNWGESYGFSWYDEEFQYLVTSTFYDILFDRAYRDCLKQYADMSDIGEEYTYYKAIAEIMKAFHFQILVDLYGDIPYTEALQRGVNATPKYDEAEAIYVDLISKLTAAIRLIKSAADSPLTVDVTETGDVIFYGHMDQWIKFANTIKIRILTRYSDVAPAGYIQQQLDSINAEGSGFITSDVEVQPGFLKVQDKQNYYWNELGWDVGGTVTLSHDATCATQYVLDYLVNTNDPRISLIYEEPTTGHLGVDQGANNNDEAFGADFVSNIGPGHLKSATMGAVIFTLAEHSFNMAELALKGYGGDPETFYNEGVLASLNYLDPTANDNDTKAATYLAQSIQNVNYAFSTNKLQAIITQKWIATNGITAEQSWFDYSRTGYPAGLPVSAQASTTDRPVRLFYPDSEETGNSQNVPTQPNAFTDKIFWAN